MGGGRPPTRGREPRQPSQLGAAHTLEPLRPQRNPCRSDRNATNTFNNCVARDMIDTTPVANVNHDNNLLGRSNVTTPATAPSHASG
jgi:hypothetical protein